MWTVKYQKGDQKWSKRDMPKLDPFIMVKFKKSFASLAKTRSSERANAKKVIPNTKCFAGPLCPASVL